MPCWIFIEQPRSLEDRGLAPTRLMNMPDDDCYIISDAAGIYEALIDLNSSLKAGDAVGQVHFPQKPERPARVYHAARDGTLIGRTHKALVESGDFLALIAEDMGS